MILPGVIASSGGIVSSFESIATVTVGSGGASTISFTSIPQTFTHLQIRGIGRDTLGTASVPSIGLRFNGDSSASYTYHAIYGNGTSAGASAATGYTYSYSLGSVGDGTTANVYSANILDILDYTSTNKNKVTRTLFGCDFNTTSYASFSNLISTLWLNTSAITSIVLYPNTSFKQYSSFALYGVKA